MKKWIFSLSLIATMSLSPAPRQNMTEHAHDVPVKAFSSHEAEFLRPEAVATGTLRVRGMEIVGFSGEALTKLNRAFQVLEAVMNSEEFKNRVINFKNKRGERAFLSNKGMTNEEVYEHLMEGREDLQPETAGEMNFYLRLYNSPWSRVIGYTSGDTNVISINQKYFRNFTPADVAGNLAHEWTHKMGFDHRSASEHDSVPYAVGYIVDEMAAKLLKNPVLH